MIKNGNTENASIQNLNMEPSSTEEEKEQYFNVNVRETLIQSVRVKALSIEKAKEKVKEMYDNDEIVLTYEDFTGDVDVRVADDECDPLEEWDENYIR